MIELSQQQANTLELFLEGKSMKQMALTLGVSYSRIVNLLNEVLIKTGTKSRKELLIHGNEIEYVVKSAQNQEV